jgi:hypothetical protein
MGVLPPGNATIINISRILGQCFADDKRATFAQNDYDRSPRRLQDADASEHHSSSSDHIGFATYSRDASCVVVGSTPASRENHVLDVAGRGTPTAARTIEDPLDVSAMCSSARCFGSGKLKALVRQSIFSSSHNSKSSN